MAIVRLDKIQASYNGNLESVKHTADMTNGLFVVLGDLVTGERELHNAVIPVEADIEGSEFLLVASPEVMYDERKNKLADFVISAEVPARAYHLVKGDVITLTKDLFVAEPTVGQYAVPEYDGSMKLTASADGTILASDGTTSLNPTLVFKVIEADSLGEEANDAGYVLKVV